MTKSTPALDGGAAGGEALRPTWVRWQIVILLMAFSYTSWFNRVAIPVVDHNLTAEFGFTSRQIGLMDSTLLLAYTLCMTPGGWFVDRFGPRKGILVVGLGSGVAVALTGLAGMTVLAAGLVFASFLIIRALMGTFSAPIYPSSGKLVANWIPFTRRAWANGLITGAAPLGAATAHVLFGKLADTFTWRGAFLLAGAFTVVLALLWVWYGKDRPAQHRAVNAAELDLIRAGKVAAAASADPPGKEELRGEDRDRNGLAPGRPAPAAGWTALFGNRSLMLLTVSYGAVSYFEYLFLFCTEYYFKGVLQLSVEQSRWDTMIATLGMVVGIPLGGLVSDLLVERYGYRLGRTAMPVLGMLGGAATLYAATFTRDPSWTLVWFTLAHAAIGATEGAFWSTAIELGGRWGGTSGGIVNTGGNLGGTLAPYATRWVGEAFNWRWGMYLGCLVCLAGASLWTWINPGERPAERD